MASRVARLLVPAAASFLAPGIGSALGLSGIGGALAGGAISGGLSSAITGGNPLTGALTGGIGGAASNLLGGSGLFGTSAGTPLGGGFSGPTQGSGLLGSATRGLSDLTSGLGLTGGGGSSMFGGSSGGSSFRLGDILGGLNSYNAQDDIAEQQRRALEQAQGQFGGYAQTGNAANQRLGDLLGLTQNSGADGYGSLAKGFTMDDFQNDPGYQFRLSEGQNAIDKQLAAQGMSNSGAAVKASGEYAQNLANQQYNQSYDNWLNNQIRQYNQLQQTSGTGQQAAGSLAELMASIGQVNASQTAQQSNIVNQGLAGIFGSGGNENLLSDYLRRQMGMA